MMQMDDTDIRISYNDAVDKKQQVEILADLNACSVWEMRNKLLALGCKLDGRWFQDKNPNRIRNQRADVKEENANLIDENNELKDEIQCIKKDLAQFQADNAALEKENEALRKLCQGLQNQPHFEERDTDFVFIIGQTIGALHMVSKQLGPRDGGDYLKELAECLHLYAAGGQKDA